MNTIQLKNILKSMATKHGIYANTIYDGIITAIMNHYMTTVGYYEEHAIESMNKFLKENILVF